MKNFWLILVFISVCAFAKAQDDNSKTTVDTVQFKLGVGDYQVINDIEITFLEVLEDSRCPKDVDCVWAGQAKIKVRVSEKGKEAIEKEVVLSSLGIAAIIHKSDAFVIKAVNLSPYPKTTMPAKDRVYYLELQV